MGCNDLLGLLIFNLKDNYLLVPTSHIKINLLKAYFLPQQIDFWNSTNNEMKISIIPWSQPGVSVFAAAPIIISLTKLKNKIIGILSPPTNIRTNIFIVVGSFPTQTSRWMYYYARASIAENP